MKLSIFSRIKTIFKNGVKSFDEKNPGLKIDAMIEHNSKVIKDVKNQLIRTSVDKMKLERQLTDATNELKQSVAELKKAKNENRDCFTYAMQVKAKEELIDKIKQSINNCDDLYKQGLTKVKEIQDKNKSIEISKNIMLTKLAIAKIQETHLNIDTDGIFDAKDVFDDIMDQVDKSDAKYNLEKDLGNVKEEKPKSYSNEDIEDIINRYV